MSVYQNKRGKWFLNVAVKGERYHRSIAHASSRKEAKEFETMFKAEILKEKASSAKNTSTMTFTELVEIYRKYAEATKLSYRKEQTRINDLLGFFSDIPISEITTINVELYRAMRKKHIKKNGQPLTNASINREVTILSRMLSLAVESGLIQVNPCHKIKKLRENSAPDRYLQPAEEEKLLSLCTGRREYMKAIIIAMVNLGTRVSELKNLRWECVNLKDGYVKIINTKTGRDRYIPINSKLRPYLEALYKKRQTGYVFTNPITNNPYRDFDCFEYLCKKAELEGITPKTLRHTFASRLVERGVDLITVKDLMGHSTINMTARYSHSNFKRSKQAVNMLVYNSN